MRKRDRERTDRTREGRIRGWEKKKELKMNSTRVMVCMREGEIEKRERERKREKERERERTSVSSGIGRRFVM